MMKGDYQMNQMVWFCICINIPILWIFSHNATFSLKLAKIAQSIQLCCIVQRQISHSMTMPCTKVEILTMPFTHQRFACSASHLKWEQVATFRRRWDQMNTNTHLADICPTDPVLKITQNKYFFFNSRPFRFLPWRCAHYFAKNFGFSPTQSKLYPHQKCTSFINLVL